MDFCDFVLSFDIYKLLIIIDFKFNVVSCWILASCLKLSPGCHQRSKDLKWKRHKPQVNNLNLSSGRFLKLSKINPAGSLEARKLSDGSIMFYWRYTFDQKTQRSPIGLYNPNNPPRSLAAIQGKYSILAAERAAEDMALMHHKNIHEGGGGFAEIERRKKAEIQIKKKQREQQQTYTVEHLLTLYCELLQQRGKVSYKDAQYLFKNHFITPLTRGLTWGRGSPQTRSYCSSSRAVGYSPASGEHHRSL